MPGDDGLELRDLQGAGFNGLEEASLVLRAASLQRDDSDVFGGEDPSGRAFDVLYDGIAQGLLDQQASGWKDRP